MPSYILGKVELDSGQLEKDLETVRTFPRISEEYDEFSSGFWMNISLWNASGDKFDTMYRNFDHPAQQTEYGRQLPYIDQLIRENFTFDHLPLLCGLGIFPLFRAISLNFLRVMNSGVMSRQDTSKETVFPESTKYR